MNDKTARVGAYFVWQFFKPRVPINYKYADHYIIYYSSHYKIVLSLLDSMHQKYIKYFLVENLVKRVCE